MERLYTLKTYPSGGGREVCRTLEICGADTLDDLCMAILQAFDFYHEHLYEFCMDNRMYQDGNYQSDPEMEDDPSTDIALDSLGLVKGQKFSLHYDFGDDWMFPIRVMKITDIEKYRKPAVIAQKGKIEQYPDYDEEDEWEDEDEE